MLSTVIRPIRPDLAPRLGGCCSRNGSTQIDTLSRVSVRNTNTRYCNTRNCDKCWEKRINLEKTTGLCVNLSPVVLRHLKGVIFCLKIGLTIVISVLWICQLSQNCHKSENCLKIVLRSSVNLGPGNQSKFCPSFWDKICPGTYQLSSQLSPWIWINNASAMSVKMPRDSSSVEA